MAVLSIIRHWAMFTFPLHFTKIHGKLYSSLRLGFPDRFHVG